MIKRLVVNDSKILDYISTNYSECLYLYIDYVKYGISNENVKIWVQTSNDHNIICVILKYYTGMHIYSKLKNLYYEEIVNIIREEKPSIICAHHQIIKNLENRLTNYDSEYGSVRELASIDEKYNYNVINKCKDEDFKQITELLLKDEMGRSYSYKSLYNQLKERNDSNFSRNYVIKDGNNIVSHAATGAEIDNAAILTYVITAPKSRGNGYATKVVGKLCYDLINEGKKIYLINYTDESTALYTKLGFKQVATIGKLVLKK